MKQKFLSSAAAREVAILTAGSVLACMASTALLMASIAGVDFGAKLTVGEVWAIAMLISILAPLVICPAIAAPGRRLIADLRRTRADLEQALREDALTGLLNRRGFDEAAAERLSECNEEGTSTVALMCDIDLFKVINDKLGHDFGDGALERIALLLHSTLGARDSLIGRLCGEEFVILLPDCEMLEGEKIADAIRAACEALTFEFNGLCSHVTLSLGVAAVETDDEDLRSLLSRADAALFQAKRDGRNRVVAAPNRATLAKAA
jgi:diguanylate cyclase (GGDEF)-like protein